MRPIVALRLLVVATALAVVTGAPTAVLGVFTASRSVASNSFSSGSCMLPRVSDVQRGTATSSADGTLTVAITAVDPTRAFLLFSTRHANNRPVGSMLRGQLASSTALHFTRVTDEVSPPPITIEWSVVEYECGVLVQRGETTMTTATVDVTLAAVSTDRSFVLFSKTVYAAAGAFGADETQVAEVTGPTTLQLRTPATGGIVAWQVVSFTEAGAASVQRGSTSLGTADTAVTVPIASADPSRTLVLASHQSSTASGPDMGARMVRVELASSTSLAVSRSTVGSSRPIEEVHWQVVELLDGSQVQSGVVEQTAAVTSSDVALPRRVDLRRASALGSVQHGSGQNAGRGSYVTDDTPGEMSFTLQLLDASTLRVTRQSAVDEASVAWSVVEWGRAHTSPTCGLPRVRDIQRGTVTSTTGGTITVAIRNVALDKSFLLFTVASSGSSPGDATVRGRLHASTLTFDRNAGSTAPVLDISWTVVEYECGVRVQRGFNSLSPTPLNVTLNSPVATLDQAFVTFSKTPAASNNDWGSDDTVVVDLVTTNTLQIRAGQSNANHSVAWQVIEFTVPGSLAVERGSASMTGTSATVTLSRPVDLTKTFVLTAITSSGAGDDIGSRMVRAHLSDANTLVIERATAGTLDPIEEISWQVVQLNDGSRVLTGSESFAAGVASLDAPTGSMDLRRATGFATFQHSGGQSGGMTPYIANDVPGVATWTVRLLSANQLRLTRNSTVAEARVQWQVVEWGQP